MRTSAYKPERIFGRCRIPHVDVTVLQTHLEERAPCSDVSPKRLRPRQQEVQGERAIGKNFSS